MKEMKDQDTLKKLREHYDEYYRMLTDSTSPVRGFRVNSLRENIKRMVGGVK